MKIPFPIKAFLSYLAILTIGALPMWIYISISFSEDLIQNRYEEMIEKTARLNIRMRDLSREKRNQFLKNNASHYIESIALLDKNGRVYFDSVPTSSLSYSNSTPELKEALGLRKGSFPGVGVSKRKSGEGEEMLFVARQISDSDQVLRLGYPISKIEILRGNMVSVFRNGLAGAITLAMLFSFLAAFLFSRPLRRLGMSANAISEGQFEATEIWNEQHEIADVGRALNSLALKLRFKLAGAYAKESLMIQVISNIESSAIVFDNNDEIVIASGVLRERLNGDFAEIVGGWTRTKNWKLAKEKAKNSIQGIALEWLHSDINEALELHELEHGDSPFWMISSANDIDSLLPFPEDCSPVSLASLIEKLEIQSKMSQGSLCVAPEILIEFNADIQVVDIGNRISIVLENILCASSRKLIFSCEKHLSKISIRIDLILEPELLQICKDLLRPIDSDVKIESDSSVLWLRRA